MKYIKTIVSAAMVTSLCASASAAFVLNEVDADTPGTDAAEFVELKGNPGESAAGLILVFFDGSDGSISYNTVDIGALTADSNGYILVGDPNVPNTDMVLTQGFIHNGEDAVALYSAPASSFPNGSVPTTTNLIDVLVYDNNQANQNWSGFGSPTVYNEGGAGPGGVTEHSLARIPDGSTGAWVQTVPTPKAANNDKTFVITEPVFVRVNQATAAVPSTRTLTLRNSGSAPLTINSLQLDGSSSAAFTATPATPTLPTTLQYDQETSIVVQLLETDVSTNKSYTGSITYTTDSPTSPSGSVAISSELVRGTAAPVGSVKVNEICYNPGSVDHNHDGSTTNQNDEYVELFNTTAAPILIEGWEQRCGDFDSDNFHSFVFPAGATIPANGYVTVFTSGNPTGFLPGTTFTYIIPRIRNTGSFVGISDATKLIDGVAFLGAQDSPDADAYVNAGVSAVAGGSIGRRPDGSATFRAFAPTDPTPTDQPSPNLTNSFNASVSDWSLF